MFLSLLNVPPRTACIHLCWVLMASFVPRRVYPNLDSLPRSYFLGHHHTGLAKMKKMLSGVDLIIECRDFRVPVTSRNPLFEENLSGRPRVIVYTKRDLVYPFGRPGTESV